MSATSAEGGTALRAAVIGASGIGKHHAKWYHLAACEVVAICGRAQASAERTAGTLADLFGFDGTPYWDVHEMLEREQPDVVSVATWAELHLEHAVAALEAGAQVMCEKPLVWDKTKDRATMMTEAEQICAAAEAQQRLLAVNTQYVAGAEQYIDWVLGGERPKAIASYFMQIDSRGARGPVDREQIWIDLASHPISVLMAFVPDGQMREDSLRCQIEEKRVVARFEYVSPTTGVCDAEIVVGNVPEGELVRRFGINGELVDYEGRNDEQGVYCAYLSHGGQETKRTDFVQTSLERFIGAARGEGPGVLASGRDGLKNLDMQLAILERGKRSE
jgi:predicted dehydrogenase